MSFDLDPVGEYAAQFYSTACPPLPQSRPAPGKKAYSFGRWYALDCASSFADNRHFSAFSKR